MKKASIVHLMVLLLLMQGTISSCCISRESVAKAHYSAENFKALTLPKQFYLISLKSVDRHFESPKFEKGNVCLVIQGLDSQYWAIKDEAPWHLVPLPLPDESPWNFLDLSKANWYASRVDTALSKSDPRISQYQLASATSFLSDLGETKVLDLIQVYQKIENCFGVVLVGKKRCYFFHNLNHVNYNLRATGALMWAFSDLHDEFPHEVLMESNDFEDIEKAARRFAEQTRLAQKANENEVRYDPYNR
jgi:hypothetical protein